MIGHTVSAATYPWNLDFPVCHMALVSTYGGHTAIFESTIDKGLGPCLHARRDDVKGVQVHLLEDRLKLHLDYRGGRAWRLPLSSPVVPSRMWQRNPWYSLDNPQQGLDCLEETCTDHLGVKYDLLGALQARSFGFGWTRRFRRERTDANRKFFCSELVADIYQHMGWLPQSVIPSHENPKSATALLVGRGVCGPPEEILL